MIDVLEVRQLIRDGDLKIKFHRNKILLIDVQSGEAAIIGELPKGEDDENQCIKFSV